MGHWTYLVVLLGCLCATVPLELAFGLRVLTRPGTLAAALLPGLILFGGWDLYAVHAHQWSYDPRHLVGLTLPGGLPLEEVLFFLVIPICAVLTFEAVQVCHPRVIDRLGRRPTPAQPKQSVQPKQSAQPKQPTQLEQP